MSEVINIPDGWVETTLGKSINLIGGGTPNTSIPEYWSGDIPWLSVVDFNDDNRWVYSAEKSITELGLKKSSTKVLNIGDIIISARGTVGAMAQLKNAMAFNQSCYGIKEKEDISDINFIFYLLKYSLKQINRNTYGAVFDTITTKTFDFINIILPQISAQQSIAKILTSFDDKIELLQAQNKTLEALAQTIFTEWFGKYQVEDELPVGWRVYELNELVSTINGYSYKGVELIVESEDALVTLKSFDRNGGFQTRGFKPFKGNPKNTQEVKIGDLVVAHTDLTQDAEVLGNPAFIFDDGGFKRMYITMDLVKVIPTHKDVSSSFLYYLMKDKAFKGHCVGYANGTTVLHMSKKAIPEYQIYLPKDFELVKQFSEIANNTTNKISLNKLTIKSLTQTRDTLLPKLMSGEIRVNEFKV
jgi:type I restriction enzyme S subunit